MGVEYRIDILNTSGTKTAEIGGEGAVSFLDLSCSKQVNAPGLLSFALNADHAAVALLTDKTLVHLYRRWPEQSINWYIFFYGMFRGRRQKTTDAGDKVFAALCPGQMSMLNWRHNAYASGTANKTTWSAKAAETIMKNLVTNNLTSTGTTGNGRDRNATSLGAVNGYTITVETDSLRGTTLNFSSTRKKVLKDLQDVANAAGTGDFDLVKTAATTWDFRYYPLLGTDRTATVVFSEDFGNMRRPELVEDWSSEETAIIVGGGGTGSGRAKVMRTGTNYNASTNDIEGFADGASSTGGTTNTTTLNAIGDREATKRRKRAVLTYSVAQVSASLLDKHYFLGDKVTARAYGSSLTQQVYGVDMTFKPTGAGEELAVRMRDYGA